MIADVDGLLKKHANYAIIKMQMQSASFRSLKVVNRLKIRYFFGVASVAYMVAMVLALLDMGIFANMLAAAAAFIMLPCVAIGGDHLAVRAPSEANRVFIIRWRLLMMAWTVLAIIVHIGAALFAEPQSAVVWAIMPIMLLLPVGLLLMSDPS